MRKRTVNVKRKRRTVEHADGWGIRVGGSMPYIAFAFFKRKEEAQAACSEPYHRPIKVRIVDARDYKPKA